MKKLFRIICLIISAAALAVCVPGANVLCYYSGAEIMRAYVSTGSVELAIENFEVDGNLVARSAGDTHVTDGILELNTSQAFAFTVRNAGKSNIDYGLDIEISWDGALPAAGKLFIYPADTSDETILQNLENGDYTGAVVGADVSDSEEIETSAGTRYGIVETLGAGSLAAATYRKPSFEDYALKLFFYADAEIGMNPAPFENQFLEIGISGRADVTGKQTGWETVCRAFFRTVTSINTARPVISEVPGRPKTYFITQSDAVDLRAYAAAEDESDGDITNKIVITSYPQFDKDKAGAYTVTYNVRNSSGIFGAPVQVTVVIWDFVKVASGTYHSLALTSHGKVYAWGRNVNGQLGEAGGNRSVPKVIDGLDDITDIAACNSSSYALASDGQLYAWGHNGYGHLGDGTTVDKTRPVKVVQPDGTAFTRIGARFNTAGAITTEGDVYTWGYGEYGQTGAGVATVTNTVPQKIDISNAVQLDFGRYGGAALSASGALYTWGLNNYGQLGTGAALNQSLYTPVAVSYFLDQNISIAQFSAGAYHMAAVSSDGRLFTWGNGDRGSLGDGGTSLANVPQYIPLPSAASKITAGTYSNAVITEEGDAYVFGGNAFGKLGTGNTDNVLTPALLKGISNVTYISMGEDNTFVLSGGAVLYAMGNGQYGGLGNGGADSSSVPVVWAFVSPAPY